MSHHFPYKQDGFQPYPGLEVALSSPENSGFEITASVKVDSGADRTIIPTWIVEELHLVEIEAKLFEGADGHIFSMPLFIIYVRIANLPECRIVAAASDAESMVLLGLDVLNLFRATLDGPNQTLEIG